MYIESNNGIDDDSDDIFDNLNPSPAVIYEMKVEDIKVSVEVGKPQFQEN